ncbi:hypothetical protein V1520DRAFT_13625 [Lipomyces starkeyi]|uniref:Replication origin-binding protein domain-containing protein n=1 Tax=Lipomyces starkeyi NRRL Y-11557 TaxID=675824 RepID=A0A1E3QED9_LIPST|nr:hypothetical protein LIPSTDRAFT_223614 [Lipomyces starkeyi NRRL Y-11557]
MRSAAGLRSSSNFKYICRRSLFRSAMPPVNLIRWLHRLFFLDAPMGTGKTHCVREYLRANSWLSVLSITFRQSLARYLSSEFGLSCYLDNGFWAPDATAQRTRCVICLDSIGKLRPEAEPYDLIIIDECVFVQYHFLAGTITDRLPDVMRTFDRLLQDSGRVIYMQHRIPENYGHGRGQPWSRSAESKCGLHPMKVLTSRSSGGRTLTAYLASWYIWHFDRHAGRSTMPTVVFTTMAHHAGLLLSLLRKIATEHFGEEAASRIKGIWAGIQDDAWIRQFLAHPNTAVDQVDVLISTSVLQAGHSLDRYFRVSFDFLFRGVLSFREELQFTSRLRYIGRDDMAEYKFCWIPAGGAGARRAGQRRLKLDIEQTWPEGAARWGGRLHEHD